MTAGELLASGAPFVIDTSAWWRLRRLPEYPGQLAQRAVEDDRIWITPVVRMEVLYSARDEAEYAKISARLDSLRMLRDDRGVSDTAMSALGELARRAPGYHRVPTTDALIAAAAGNHGGVAVLHRNAHFDRLAEVLAFDSVQLPVD